MGDDLRMGRLARLVFLGLPHHVTQRGNGRAQTFFDDTDYALYRDLLAASCRAANVEIWSWVLMPNHVHLILMPADADGIRRALAAVHRRYAGAIHARLKRTGHFWQSRFGAVAMDEIHLAAAVRYVALNPVRARLVEQARDWPWSRCARICPAAMTALRLCRRFSTAFPALPSSLLQTPTRTCSRACAAPSASEALGQRRLRREFGGRCQAQAQAKEAWTKAGRRA